MDPEKSALLCLNFNEDSFHKIFSKLEILNALHYLMPMTVRLGMRVVYLETVDDLPDKSIAEYRKLKLSRRMLKTAPRSVMEEDFIAEFRKLVPSNSMKVESEDIFTSMALHDLLRSNGTRYIMLSGFFSETSVLRSALSSLDSGYIPAVISDAVSTFSERIYYESLDIISQSAEIIDTRDLMKRWPDQI